MRGIVALAFLKKIERTLEAEAGRFVRLCDYFDLIGGTSTGAIIAVGLALGHTVDEIRDFYVRLAPRVFRPPWVRVPGWKAIFDARALADELKGVIGDRRLDSLDLQTGIGVMLKRLDTASAWILTNNPRSAFWETPPDHSFIGNRNYSLAEIVRASTAAPHYFDPQEIEIVAGEPPGVFIDGGLTPHNNPSLALFLSVFVPQLRSELGGRPGKAHDRFGRRGHVPQPPRPALAEQGALGQARLERDDPADRRQSAAHPDADVAARRKPDALADQFADRRSRRGRRRRAVRCFGSCGTT